MGIYERWIFPRLLDWTMRNADLAAYRQRLIPLARGQVLEVGIGSGLNLPLYGSEVERVVGIEPSPGLLLRAGRLVSRSHFAVHFIRASAEAIPVRDQAVDTVVMTWTMCSIAEPLKALKEMRRVLKPSGELLFVEHGLAPEARIKNWQHRLDPLWTRISCHLDRPVDKLIGEAGFRMADLKTAYLRRGPKPMTFMYEGRARPIGPGNDGAHWTADG
ncbi:MAG: class I SAM-dependent methyltransferase [Rhizobiales bacterium]|nr:class I SAM-dependent methyltransferase [Hyphomicrobiales bacterium]